MHDDRFLMRALLTCAAVYYVAGVRHSKAELKLLMGRIRKPLAELSAIVAKAMSEIAEADIPLGNNEQRAAIRRRLENVEEQIAKAENYWKAVFPPKHEMD